MQNYTPAIESLTLIPSGQGRFEVVMDGELIFSKKGLGRHAEQGEIANLLEDAADIEAMPRE